MKPYACSDRSEKLSKKARLFLVNRGKGHQLANHKDVIQKRLYMSCFWYHPLIAEGK